jgi:hypothetical protein
MRMIMSYRDDSYQSKSQVMSLAEIKELADEIYNTVNRLDKLQFETEDGYVIFPEEVLKETIVYIFIEECDRNHPDNPEEEPATA